MRVYKFLTAHFGLKTLYERRLKISTFDDLNDPLELLPYNIRDKRKRKKIYKLKDDLKAQYGILCFSRSWTNPVIWAHYADKHHGLCLGFNVPDDRLKDVDYVENRLPFPSPIFPVEDLDVLFATKYISWKYEQEIRAVLELKKPEDGIYYHDFGTDLELAEVIGGHLCTAPRTAIERALRDHEGEVELTKARVAFGSFEVRPKASGWK
jgi:hypothetical protein